MSASSISRFQTTTRSPRVLLKSFMMGIDQWHSLTSKRKGLAGMAENVRQGFRAGGRAPRGYRLVTIETGRDPGRRGRSPRPKLEPNDDAPIVAEYLRLRAEGIGRTALMRQLKIIVAGDVAHRHGVERPHLCRPHGLERAQRVRLRRLQRRRKRRPRSEWVIQRDTHPALVSDAIAETVLQQVERASHSDSRHSGATYLLDRILKTPAGAPWHGNRTSRSEFYRAQAGNGSRSLLAERIDRAVIDTVARDFQSPEFVAAAVKSPREKFAVTHAEEIAEARRRDRETRCSQRPAARYGERAQDRRRRSCAKVDDLERERAEIEQRIVAWDKEDESAQRPGGRHRCPGQNDARPHGRRDAALRAP